jgi:acetyl-CoA C-acetyltransferase
MKAYIYDVMRTVRGKGSLTKGSMSVLTPDHIGSSLLKEFREKNQFDPKLIEDLILGCVSPTMDQGADIANTIAMTSGYGDHLAGVSLNRFCSSGLEAVNQAAAYVKSGFKRGAILAGGIEVMSRVPMGSDLGFVLDPSVMMSTNFITQGMAADLIAAVEGYSRQDLDELAVESNRRAGIAEKEGRFKSRIAIKDINGVVVLDHDENVRPNTTMEDLAKLNPAFEIHSKMLGHEAIAIDRYPQLESVPCVHTPGNSSAIVDGAAIALIGNEEMGIALGMKPRAVIRAAALTSTEKTIMLTGPGPASILALKQAGMEAKDIDLFEINEAFASVVLRFMSDLKLNLDNVNVNGGAMSLGHPLGATGCMILGTVLDELERTNKQTALVTLCVAGGMGVATIIERV